MNCMYTCSDQIEVCKHNNNITYSLCCSITDIIHVLLLNMACKVNQEIVYVHILMWPLYVLPHH